GRGRSPPRTAGRATRRPQRRGPRARIPCWDAGSPRRAGRGRHPRSPGAVAPRPGWGTRARAPRRYAPPARRGRARGTRARAPGAPPPYGTATELERRPAAEEREPDVAVAVRGREHHDLVTPGAQALDLRAGVRADPAAARWVRAHDEDPHDGTSVGRLGRRGPAPDTTSARGGGGRAQSRGRARSRRLRPRRPRGAPAPSRGRSHANRTRRLA